MTNEEVLKNVNSVAVEHIDIDLKTAFCKAWPAVKEGLQLLVKVVPTLSVVINLVITGGDALSKRICQ